MLGLDLRSSELLYCIIMYTLFIADLHLSEECPDLTEKFLQFLQAQAAQADALYILGDLFAAWIGLDFEPALNQNIMTVLKELSQKGVPIYFMQGNRDFAINKRICKKFGMILLHDPDVINLYGTNILLSHGDIFCTLDTNYQAIRKLMHNAFFQCIARRLPLFMRKRLMTRYKTQSAQYKPKKTPDMMDVEKATVDKFMQKYQVHYLIHGHTHKGKIHEFTHNNQKITRIVLHNWDQKGHALSCNNSLTFQSISF